jgi:tRNA threonylcarbamoyl adenosine modification protein (Sua5/YciO/YrdC/YwlC family)
LTLQGPSIVIAAMKSVLIRVHPSHPQKRLVDQTAEIISRGGIVVCPTDACYSLVCQVGNKAAEDRIRAIRDLERGHYFTLMCADVSALALYGKVSNAAFRLVRMLTPGPYTFILQATKETPRRLQDPKRKMVGLRVPEHPFVHALLATLDEPLLSSTLMNDDAQLPYAEPDEIVAQFGHAVNAIVDSGSIGIEMTTVLDLSAERAVLVRSGKGPIDDIADLE